MAKKNYNYDPAFFLLKSRFMGVKRKQPFLKISNRNKLYDKSRLAVQSGFENRCDTIYNSYWLRNV